ncbi:T9SS type A sorting domain-containing protein [Nibribacter ruber]|uniref:T9SS type A sorting domain-containing protein n=1 Tax=Nibribacter ruber TaxID=2698458 RepID=A0A6P1NS58_9BACT|nr:alpha-amylase family glycosyl hydrolase [Nibribacter ruber]QHL86666.1 T9SS type A sorting domain-containing protein [Nibribacter ruber]
MHAQQVQLTFRVDMSQQTVSPNGVHVAGSFQSESGVGADWNPATSVMTDADKDNVYELTVNVPAGVYEYKFINGSTWLAPQPELVPAACGMEDGAGNVNRQVTVGASNVRLPVVSFGSCTTQITFAVDMSQQTVASGGVYVMGNFQALAGYGADWNPGSIPVQDPEGDGVYTVNVALPAGGLFQYKFVNGSSTSGAEQVPSACGVSGGEGVWNRTLDATTSVKTPSFLFGSCATSGNVPVNADYPTFWWNDAVFYEIFVRSFYDSNGDGKGDFKGLIQKLDYLNDGNPATTTDLGITGIWLMPMMESPSYHGYDVTNYYATESDYGTMADFEEFLAAAHARGIKVIIDFVMNHSSDQHPWFQQSSSSTTNSFRDWYIWSDTNPGTIGPWGQGVWHQKNGKYYYGIFYSGMPDLNWSNPQLKSSMWEITRFWLNKGVDGYRIDAVKYLDEDGPKLESTPETFSLLQEFHQEVKKSNPDAFTVGEAWSNTSAVVPYVQDNRLDMAFEFDLASAIINSVKNTNPAGLRNQLNLVNRLYPKLQYATFLTNHDQNRVMDELGANLAQMKQAAALYLTMPGVPFLYYGEEVGMLGSGVDEDKRKPMQWTNGAKSGFTTGTPWRALNSNFAQFNVQTLAADPSSLLNYYKTLIHTRNAQPTLRKGYYAEVTAGNASLMSYGRVYEQEASLIVSNLGSDALLNPSISMSVSTLQAGTYQVRELIGDRAVGSVTINEQGGFSNWQIPGPLAADQTWILLLTRGTTTGIKEEPHLETTLFPNPAADNVTLTLQNPPKSSNQLLVYDVTGKLMTKTSFKGQSITLNTRSWANGTYFLKIQSEGLVTMKRLIVAH